MLQWENEKRINKLFDDFLMVSLTEEGKKEKAKLFEFERILFDFEKELAYNVLFVVEENVEVNLERLCELVGRAWDAFDIKNYVKDNTKFFKTRFD